MEVESLRLFGEVAEALSFAAVAAARNCPPSTVSRSIAALERDLGIRLFQRTTRSMTLTEAGMRFLPHALGILAACEEAREDVAGQSGEPEGSLRLAASVAFGEHVLVPLLAEWRRQFPKLGLDLVLSDARQDLITERIDLAVRLGGSPDNGLVARKLTEVRYHLCAAPAYLARHGPIEQPEDLAGHECLLYGLGGIEDTWRFQEEGAAEQAFAVSGSLRFSSAGSLLSAAKAGHGPALIADWLVARDLAAGRLQALCTAFKATPTLFDSAVWLAYPSRSFVPLKTRTMIDFLVKNLG